MSSCPTCGRTTNPGAYYCDGCRQLLTDGKPMHRVSSNPGTCDHYRFRWQNIPCPACGLVNADGRNTPRRSAPSNEGETLATARVQLLHAWRKDHERTLDRPFDYGAGACKHAEEEIVKIDAAIVDRFSGLLGPFDGWQTEIIARYEGSDKCMSDFNESEVTALTIVHPIAGTSLSNIRAEKIAERQRVAEREREALAEKAREAAREANFEAARRRAREDELRRDRIERERQQKIQADAAAAALRERCQHFQPNTSPRRTRFSDI